MSPLASESALRQRQILAAPLRLSQPRWTSQDVADLVGVSQSAVARTWKLAFSNTQDIALPEALDIQAVSYAHGHGLLLLNGLGSIQVPAPTANVMRSPRRIPLQTMLAGIVRLEPATTDEPPVSEQFTTRSPFGHCTLAVGTSKRPAVLPAHIDFIHVDHNHWQSLLPLLINCAHRTSAGNLQRIQQDLIVWEETSSPEFLWVSDLHHSSQALRPRTQLAPLRSSEQIVADQVFELIVDLIWDGHLTAGDRITESSLAMRLHTTRNQTRDALRALASSGLVDHHPVRGVLVPTPQRSDVADIYAARRALGTEILRRASENSDFDLKKVNVALQEVITVGATGNSYETGNADLHFQDVIAQESGMRNIPQMFNILAKQLRIYIAVMGLSYFYSIEDMISDDTELFRHLQNRDFELARVAWNKKINDAVTFMTTHVTKRR